jgi:hypothetical protein
MARVFRDACQDMLYQRGLTGLGLFWLHILSDLLLNASLERWLALKEGVRSMSTDKHTPLFPRRLWIALTATLIAFVVSLIASFNLYQIEDASSLTLAAYSASPLLRFSYDGIYLSALAAGVTICASVGYALIRNRLFVGVGLCGIALLVAFGGFGGLLVRHSVSFLIFLAVFVVLMLLSFLIGRAVMVHSVRSSGERAAAVLGACAGAGGILLINVAALVLHTLLLNPVNHALYMQGQIPGTHLNFSLLAMGAAMLTLSICALSLGYTLRLTARRA